MTLPISKTYPPMEAAPAASLPVGPQWQYEPKWDGFRCLTFRDKKKIDLQSKSGKPRALLEGQLWSNAIHCDVCPPVLKIDQH